MIQESVDWGKLSVEVHIVVPRWAMPFINQCTGVFWLELVVFLGGVRSRVSKPAHGGPTDQGLDMRTERSRKVT